MAARPTPHNPAAPASPPPAASTLGELVALGYQPTPVREELRRNVIARLSANRPIVEGVLGFEDTVVPQLEHALLAGHDVILLGERGQAKSRIVRSLVALLDEWLPVVAGSEINDDPFAPVSRAARDLVGAKGDETPISWVHRSDRYGEKLATPDTSIADLIGEVDPIKVAEGRYLSDELTIHYGLVPRTNRGIFAINELPDLAERIQVGLLNVLEERDIQIRGHRVRLPLDVMLVATANPDDYTSRGRIITPLKDRFGAQIRTHYPRDVATEVDIVAQEARPVTSPDVEVVLPAFMSELIARISQAARHSARVSQRSGVSVRLSVANHETLTAAALRRALRLGERDAAPRVSDLAALESSTLGKVEVEALEEGEDLEVLSELIDKAVRDTFRDHVPQERLAEVVGRFGEGESIETGAGVASADYVAFVAGCPPLAGVVERLVGAEAPPSAVASAVELVLEGLHLSRRLNKSESDAGLSTYARR
ncbi:MAG: sigma 54-interacting transcriptional regulator [Actinomycetota bacterium]|nr:sigma 54-interacting transcriptional regulator [Actinomycetota bacterium]